MGMFHKLKISALLTILSLSFSVAGQEFDQEEKKAPENSIKDITKKALKKILGQEKKTRSNFLSTHQITVDVLKEIISYLSLPDFRGLILISSEFKCLDTPEIWKTFLGNIDKEGKTLSEGTHYKKLAIEQMQTPEVLYRTNNGTRLVLYSEKFSDRKKAAKFCRENGLTMATEEIYLEISKELGLEEFQKIIRKRPAANFLVPHGLSETKHVFKGGRDLDIDRVFPVYGVICVAKPLKMVKYAKK